VCESYIQNVSMIHTYLFCEVLHIKFCGIIDSILVSYHTDSSIHSQSASHPSSFRFSTSLASLHRGSLNGHMLAALVSEFLLFLLEDLPLPTHQTMQFQNGDYPTHHEHTPRQTHFISCLGPVWPPSHSPYLTFSIEAPKKTTHTHSLMHARMHTLTHVCTHTKS
jgi:hypothetical protein